MFKVVIFGYNFPHSKCETFIQILKKYNIQISAYIAAEKIKLKLLKKKFKKNISLKPIFKPNDLCKLNNIPYYLSAHNSNKTIDIIKKSKANLGIIAGARILKSNIIDSFKYGIINFHPGKILQASGLDALLWSISKDLKPYVTTHFIDYRIDAGRRIFQSEVKINIYDRLEDIKFKSLLAEYEALEKLCKNYLSKKIKIPSKKIINYKSNNKPMKVAQKIETLNKFQLWKKKII